MSIELLGKLRRCNLFTPVLVSQFAAECLVLSMMWIDGVMSPDPSGMDNVLGCGVNPDVSLQQETTAVPILALWWDSIFATDLPLRQQWDINIRSVLNPIGRPAQRFLVCKINPDYGRRVTKRSHNGWHCIGSMLALYFWRCLNKEPMCCQFIFSCWAILAIKWRDYVSGKSTERDGGDMRQQRRK